MSVHQTHEEMMAEMNAQIVMQISGRDVTRGQLLEAFRLVSNKEHWKDKIDAQVALSDEEIEMEEETLDRIKGHAFEGESLDETIFRIASTAGKALS